MSPVKLKKLIDTEELQKIIYMHCHLKINLTDKQLDRILKLKEEKRGELWKNKSMNT